MKPDNVQRYADEVKSLIEMRLGVKARTLETALAKAGRLLPKRAQRDGAYLVDAQRYIGHPKLQARVDFDKVSKAHAALVAHLKTIDPNARRITGLLGLLGVISFNLILVGVLLVMVLIWRGYL